MEIVWHFSDDCVEIRLCIGPWSAAVANQHFLYHRAMAKQTNQAELYCSEVGEPGMDSMHSTT